MSLQELLAKKLGPLDLPEEELVYLAGIMAGVISQRIEEVSASLETISSNTEALEAKYGTDYAGFRASRQQAPGNYSLEDEVTWGFWEKIKGKKILLLNRYEQLVKCPAEC